MIGGMIFRYHFDTIKVTNKVLHVNVVSPYKAETLKEGGWVGWTIYKAERRAIIQSPMNNIKRIRSTKFEYLMILVPFFLNKMYSTTITRIIEPLKAKVPIINFVD